MSDFSNTLIHWYKQHKRELPWRATHDPYRIWLSEIILQQTRVEQGLSYYEKFVETYPTVQDLAAAPQEEILRLWQGLGYYSRARNLHAAAIQVVKQFDGRFPESYEEIRSLKGVGPYTAAAIGSFAFGLPTPVVDGNVYRLLSRYFGETTDIASSGAQKIFTALSQEHIPVTTPGLYNQAIMEFGSKQCRPGLPDCDLCPLQSSCFAFAHKRQGELPVKTKKVKVKHRYFHYVVLEFEGKLGMKQRGAKDIWQGLYDFPLIESDGELDPEAIVLKVNTDTKTTSGLTLQSYTDSFTHILSHQKLHTRFYRFTAKDLPAEITPLFHDIQQIKALPKPVLINNYLKEFYF